MAERVEYLEKQLAEMVQSMHQLITLTGTLLKDDRRAIRRLASHSPIGRQVLNHQAEGERRDTESEELSCSKQDDTNSTETFLPPQN
jgi:hypothetical protein